MATDQERPSLGEIVQGMMDELTAVIHQAGGFQQADTDQIVADYLNGLQGVHPEWGITAQAKPAQATSRTIWRVDVIQEDGKLKLVRVFDEDGEDTK